jgi:hypothetical protein
VRGETQIRIDDVRALKEASLESNVLALVSDSCLQRQRASIAGVSGRD